MIGRTVESYGRLDCALNNAAIGGMKVAIDEHTEDDFDRTMAVNVSPNPPKDTDGRREDSGRGWVRELQGRWPGVLG